MLTCMPNFKKTLHPVFNLWISFFSSFKVSPFLEIGKLQTERQSYKFGILTDGSLTLYKGINI